MVDTTTADLLQRHFDLALEAPDGIKKLRELILTLAMQGKLVPQDPNDQPANELLKAIEVEKRTLAKKGAIKSLKPSAPILVGESLFDIPSTWEWTRIGVAMTKITDGTHHSPTNVEKGDFLYISAKNIKADGVLLSNATFVTQEVHEEIYSRCNPEKGDILYIKDGATTGIATINNLTEPFSMLSSVALLKPSSGVFNVFLLQTLRSPFFYREMRSEMTGVAITRVTLQKLENAIFPLPPLPEQRRIVAKIDQLMGICDELEKRRDSRIQKRLAVHNAAIRRLLDTEEPVEFSSTWDFLVEHFSEVYSVKENVSELRKAILQLAVMGKLVKQDPNDQPASELLKEIEEEKRRSVKEGKLKAPKLLPPISPDEIPFALPKAWEWVRLGTLCISIDYGTSQKTKDDSSLVPVYRMGNIQDGTLVTSNFKYIESTIDELPYLFLETGDILFNRTNSYELVGKSAQYHGPNEAATFASYLIRIRLAKRHVSPSLTTMTMNSPFFRKSQIEPEIVQQCGQANFNGSKLSQTLVPLPPLHEQRQIVAKVDQLMSLCDLLESQINGATDKRTEVLGAVMSLV